MAENTLVSIINTVKEIMENYKEERELKIMHQKKIDQAAAGSPEAKRYIKEEITKICLKDLKDEIIRVLTNVDWKKEVNSTAMCRIKQYHIIDVLKRYIPKIK